jgi:site-specific DNA-methyltransferase (adenine-specific)
VKTLPRNQVLAGDARALLPTLLAESIDCVVTSPPYYRLRDYRVPGQIGQEPTVEEYVAHLRAVLREAQRVLKDSGSLWLNLGDGYARKRGVGVPLGSLTLVPQRLALALAADGWIVRNIVVWAKPNPLPQSARDRLSATYEVILFATKRRRYFFDLDAIRIPHRSADRVGRRSRSGLYQGGNSGLARLKAAGLVGNANGKNPGDVWTVATAVDRLGHQATFPEALSERPVLAACPERICVQCDRPWRRPTQVRFVQAAGDSRARRLVGELDRCDCFAPSRRGVVLDPFFGTGTVGIVAEKHGRDWLGIELSPRYRSLAKRRLRLTERAA